MGIKFRNKVVKEGIINQWKFNCRIFQFNSRYHPPQLEKANEFGYLIFWNKGSDEVTFWSTVMSGTLIVDPGLSSLRLNLEAVILSIMPSIRELMLVMLLGKGLGLKYPFNLERLQMPRVCVMCYARLKVSTRRLSI
jgi:hypothetical protein